MGVLSSFIHGRRVALLTELVTEEINSKTQSKGIGLFCSYNPICMLALIRLYCHCNKIAMKYCIKASIFLICRFFAVLAHYPKEKKDERYYSFSENNTTCYCFDGTARRRC
jgi:hypothetical protein